MRRVTIVFGHDWWWFEWVGTNKKAVMIGDLNTRASYIFGGLDMSLFLSLMFLNRCSGYLGIILVLVCDCCERLAARFGLVWV